MLTEPRGAGLLFLIFTNADGYNDLWYITWEKIGEFLPNLKDELFPEAKDIKPPTALPSIPQQPTLGQTSPTFQSSSPTFSTPTLVSGTPTLVAPVPVSGTVPIRNPLYDQTGLSASVLLQPLNEMVSTPIGRSLQSQVPTLYRAPEQSLPPPQPVPQVPLQIPQPVPPQIVPIQPVPPQLQSQSVPPQPTTPQVPLQTVQTPQIVPLQLPSSQVSVPDPKPGPIQPTIIDLGYDDIMTENNPIHSELFAEYVTNPYNTISPKDPENKDELRNPLLDKKSLSANATPMHVKNKALFGSTDNVSQSFNFTNYFGSVDELVSPGAEVFDSLTGDG